ncbi:CRISPR-associated helicase Cas3' [Brachyspira aalborgi]|uniref:CRISPR-associated helicase Cas3' n=1 Tax=Brachyspira aalborgi TaxID=29522 RepID=UPI00266644E1|nr:CRISPR-associated helicase Cas3' [Brachyspira aalborgi]
MDKEKYLAKSSKKNQYNEESLERHTNKLINLFKDFISKYGEKFTKKEIDLIMLACEKHDLGKLNYKFQKEMYKKSKLDFKENEEIENFYKEHKNLNPIPHGILSCCFINSNELKEKYGFDKYDINVLATSIYNHHNREFNSDDYVDIFEEIIEKDLKVNAKNYGIEYCNSIGLSKNKIKNNKIEINIEYQYNFWLKFIVVKGMLNKIDYAASTYLYNKKDTGLDTLELTPEDAGKGVIKKFGDKLKDCQKFMKDNNDKNIIVIASTGIGKTEGALLWAGDSKTFYTLPIKVSINAIYKRIWDENYYDKNKFTFLHSDAKSIMRKDEEIDDYQLKYIETRHLIYPLTICTVDQLFYFVFKSLGTEKYAATLKYSKIIIDEIQSYTPDIISFLIFGLKVVNDLGGKFCIMTATLPPIVKYFLEETIGKENIKIAEKPFYKKYNNGNIIIRHKIKYEEKDFEYNEILEKAKNNKVLIICNTVRRSQDVYIKLKEKNKQNTEINLLHSRFIFKDRKIKEKIIQNFAYTKEEKRNNDAGIWISTQIVEASLDIDFDVLYTDMCSADSLLQRMGRCYRNRIYEKDEPNIFIYNNKDGKEIGVETVYDKDIFKFSVEHIQEYNNKIFTEEDKQDYINKVYDIEKLKNIDNENSYYKTIKKNIKDLEIFPIGGIDKETAEEQFRNIQNITVIPLKFYEKELKDILQKYDETFGEEKMDIIEEIMNYTLSAHSYLKKYAVEKINNKGLEHIHICNLKYDDKLGLINEKEDDEIEFKNRCI